MLTNVYDFDGTIYRGDSSADFYRFCLRRYPAVWLEAFGILPLFWDALQKKRDLTQSKQRFYRYLTRVPKVSEAVSLFWREHEKNIKGWYRSQKRADDLIVSASPEFLLSPVCQTLGVRLIGSRVDPKTGVYDGLNCHDEEKVRRLGEAYPGLAIGRFYTDSRADAPLARLAREAYLVRGDAITRFPL